MLGEAVVNLVVEKDICVEVDARSSAVRNKLPPGRPEMASLKVAVKLRLTVTSVTKACSLGKYVTKWSYTRLICAYGKGKEGSVDGKLWMGKDSLTDPV